MVDLRCERAEAAAGSLEWVLSEQVRIVVTHLHRNDRTRRRHVPPEKDEKTPMEEVGWEREREQERDSDNVRLNNNMRLHATQPQGYTHHEQEGRGNRGR